MIRWAVLLLFGCQPPPPDIVAPDFATSTDLATADQSLDDLAVAADLSSDLAPDLSPTDGGGPAALGEACVVDSDCASGLCFGYPPLGISYRCTPATCRNHVTDPDETDRDCGGPICRDYKKCTLNQMCQSDDDCWFQPCYQGICQVIPTCDDGRQNQDETNVDCGGATCAPCAVKFAPVVLYPMDASARAVVAADFNGDGHLDLAVTMAFADEVRILTGDGTGAFSVKQTISVTGDPEWLALGDFNGDGKLDLVTANFSSDDVSVLLGAGDATFVEASRPSLGGQSPVYVAVADFNHDGKLDIAVAHRHVSFTIAGSNDVRVALGDGSGGFALADTLTGGDSPLAIAVADLDADGNLDLAVGNFDISDTENLSIFRGAGDGTFSHTAGYGTAPNLCAVAVADLDGDGKLDIAGGAVAMLWSFPGNGDATFGLPTVYEYYAQARGGIGIADLDGDGNLDVAETVVASMGSIDELAVFPATGAGVFVPTSLRFPGAPVAGGLALGDFDEDGQTDVAVAFGGQSSSSTDSALGVYLNRSR